MDRRGWVLVGASLVVAAVVLVGAFGLVAPLGSGDAVDRAASRAAEGYGFDFAGWEASHLPNRLLGWAARGLGVGGDVSEGENGLEARIEREITAAAVDLGLETALPLFGGVRLVWPPVDVEIEAPLRVLAVSPRDRIRLVDSRLLRSELPRGEFGAIEAALESELPGYSAWVQTVGGVATYPSAMVEASTYERTLRLAGHEWVHQYLAFHPLGLAYFRGGSWRTVNETVAGIVGDEIGNRAAELFGAGGAEAAAAGPVDTALRRETDAILRELRIEVDALLATGRIGEAEALMESTRVELAAMGREFRRINQAFFAFRGGYGANPSSASPIGPSLARLRAESGSAAAFLALVRGWGDDSDIAALLEEE